MESGVYRPLGSTKRDRWPYRRRLWHLLPVRYVEIPFTVEANYAGWRLDRYLQEKLKRASRAQVQRLIREQLVQRGPRRLKASTPVTAGMVVVLRRPEVPEPAGIPDRLPVLFDDGRVLVVDKPAGLPVHPTARYYLGTATTILGRDHRDAEGVRPDPAHRLDRETSGALVCGRGKPATQALKAAFAPGAAVPVRKTYLAIVEGAPGWTSTRIALPLGLAGEHEVRIRVSVLEPGHPAARTAATRVRVLGRRRDGDGAWYSLVACRLETGRQHQIRAHLQAAGYPVVGDKIYGPDEGIFVRFTEGAMTDADRAQLRLPRQALHAARVRIPALGIKVTAPMPEDLRGFWEGLEAG